MRRRNSQIKFRFFPLSFMLLALLCGNRSICQADDNKAAAPKLEELLDLLKIRAHSLTRIRWDFHTTQLTGTPSHSHGKGVVEDLKIAHQTSVEEMVENDEFVSSGTALIDVQRGYYNVSLFGLGKWRESATGTIQRNISSAYDGAIHGRLEQYREPGLGAPESSTSASPEESSLGREIPPLVQISNSMNDVPGNLALLADSGIHYLPTSVPVFEGMPAEGSMTLLRFIDLAKAKADVSLEVHSDSEWNLSIPLKPFGVAEYSFDPMRSGLLTKCARLSQPNGPALEDIKFQHSKISGVWCPTNVDNFYWVDGRGKRSSFTNIIVDPDIDEKAFQVSIPVGAQVQDHVNRMFYTASQNPVDDAAALAKYVSTFELAPPASKQVPMQRSWLLIASLTAIPLLMVFVVLKYRTKGTKASILLLVSLPGLTGCNVDDAPLIVPQNAIHASSPTWDNGWTVGMDGHEPIRINQCGFAASITALEILGIDSDAILVSRSLKPSHLGIKMSEIKRTLEAYGVSVEARKHSQLSEVINSLSMADVAIIFMPKNSKRSAHYALVSSNSQGQTMYVDPPHAPVNLNRVDTKYIDNMDDLAVLFCSKLPPTLVNLTPDVQSIRFTPKDFKFGVFEGQMMLTNESGRPVALIDAQHPCSCVSVDFSPVILAPSQSIKYDFSVDGARWGSSDTTRASIFFGPNGPIARVIFSGSAYGSGKASQSFRSISRRIQIEPTCGLPCLQKSFDIPIEINNGTQPRNLRVETADEWCVGRIDSDNDGSTLVIECKFAEEQIQQMSDGGQVDAAALVYLDGESIPIYQVIVSFSRTIGIDFGKLSFANDSGDSIFRLSNPSDGDNFNSGWEIKGVEMSGNKVAAALQPQFQGSYRVQFRCKRSTETQALGYAVVSKADQPDIRVPFVVTTGTGSPIE